MGDALSQDHIVFLPAGMQEKIRQITLVPDSSAFVFVFCVADHSLYFSETSTQTCIAVIINKRLYSRSQDFTPM